MNYHSFVGQVQHRARLGTTQDAVLAAHATLTTLGERLPEDERRDLSAQLPTELAYYLDAGNSGQKFDVEEFFNRISSRENIELSDAVYHARVVLEVLQEAVSGNEISQVKQRLPKEFRTVFESGSAGKMKLQ